MAKQFDCECYLRALEEQADSIGGAATSMLEAVETFRRSAESLQRTVENLKTMISMTRSAMNLAHGGRVVEKTNIKRETLSPIVSEEDWDDRPSHNYSEQTEDWDAEANEPSYSFEDRNLSVPAYRTVKLARWGERCPACGSRYCACS